MLENWMMPQLNEDRVMITPLNKMAVQFITEKACEDISIKIYHKGG